eukprot:TRINITY_DN19842_c0_g1_i1.p1 TRINITY_DN19842_c0_g1~~TRINITY_DN19842_c0_g1_i1.p1  ORF type:complete len:144 (+),score=26.57 TRINITY_DN19842_c0_g1_i1:64-495(+)
MCIRDRYMGSGSRTNRTNITIYEKPDELVMEFNLSNKAPFSVRAPKDYSEVPYTPTTMNDDYISRVRGSSPVQERYSSNQYSSANNYNPYGVTPYTGTSSYNENIGNDYTTQYRDYSGRKYDDLYDRSPSPDNYKSRAIPTRR